MNTPSQPIKQPVSYSDLQHSVDALVGRFGLETTVEIINHFSRSTRIGGKKMRRLKLLRDFIISETIAIFDLDEQQFFTSEVTEYRSGRMVCYHLLDKYTHTSHARIAEVFGKKRGSAWYFINKCNEILTIPQYYPGFVQKYKAVESSTIHFMTTL